MPRRRFFLGCEGASERGYGALLQHLAAQLNPSLHIHLDLHDLHGGDPLAIVQAACSKAKERARARGPFVGRAVLVDADRLRESPARDSQIDPLAGAERLLVVWQRPCHEGFLLRHLSGCQTLMPQDRSAAIAMLNQHWPGYHKAMPALRLTARLGLAEVQAASKVEPELSALLTLLGFPLV